MTTTSDRTTGRTQFSPDYDKPPPLDTKIKRVWDILVIVGTIIGGLFVTGLVAAQYKDIPDRVEKLETKLNKIEAKQNQQICLSVAQRMQTPWESCLR